VKNLVRINKYLSLCGLGARRKVEAYITAGRIKINGKITRDLSSAVDSESDIIELDGRRIKVLNKFYYIMLNKPKGYITSLDDEQKRPVVMNLIPERFRKAGIFPVGRLDRDSEGLLLLTNDGDLANGLIHPRYEIQKEYVVDIDKPLEEEDRQSLQRGIYIDGKKTSRAEVDPLNDSRTAIKIKISEGKKRQIRIMFTHFRYRVKRLRRVAIGPLRLKGVNSGDYRLLKDREISALKNAIAI
jgi:23S rRNA pseudouridine2605 synthase